MNGCKLNGTPLMVDYWENTNYDKKNVFFLTHLHADHMKGLTSSWKHTIYTSPLNCSLLKEKFQFQDGLVVPLELDEPYIVTLNDEEENTITVTLFDANHVPGAVMFLFQGNFGNIFYTGDMRFYPEIFEHPILKSVLEGDGIDELYLDNTFLLPTYDFPSRNIATQMVFEIIEKHPNHHVKLGIRTLGKEDLLEAIAQKFNSLICVDEVKFSQIQLLKRPKVYTTRFSDTRFHAVSLQRIHTRNHQKWNELHPTICIRPTALEFGIHSEERSSVNIEGVFTIPYSDHSSWSELMNFVAAVKPKNVIPIVKRDLRRKDRISMALRGNDDVSVFSKFLSVQFKKSPFVSIPISSFLATCKPLRHTFDLQNRNVKSFIQQKRKKKVEKGVLFTSFEETEKSLENYDTILPNKVGNNEFLIGTNVSVYIDPPQVVDSVENASIFIHEEDANEMNNEIENITTTNTTIKHQSFVTSRESDESLEKYDTSDILFATALNKTGKLLKLTEDNSSVQSICSEFKDFSNSIQNVDTYLENKYF